MGASRGFAIALPALAFAACVVVEVVCIVFLDEGDYQDIAFFHLVAAILGGIAA